MKRNRIVRLTGFSVCLAAALLSGGASLAGVVAEMVDVHEGAEGSVNNKSTLYAQDGNLRIDVEGDGVSEMTMLFREGEILSCVSESKECMRVTAADLETFSYQIALAMEEMEKQLAALPPEQQAMVREMMKGQLPPGMGEKPEPLRIEKGGRDEVAGYGCTVHTGYRGETKSWEVCIADPGTVPGASSFEAAMQAMESMTASINELPMAEALNAGNPFADMTKVDGVPVRTRSFVDGAVATETVLSTATEKDLDPSMFEIPEGYEMLSIESMAEQFAP